MLAIAVGVAPSVVASTQHTKANEDSETRDGTELREQNDQERNGQIVEGPKAHAHERHSEKHTERDLGDERERGGASRPAPTWGDSRQQVRQCDAGEKASDEQRHLDAQAGQRLVGQHTEDAADVDPQDRVKKGKVIDLGSGILVSNADIGHFPRCRLQAVPLDQEASNRASRYAPEQEADGGAKSADLERADEPVLFFESRSPGDRRSVAAAEREASRQHAAYRRVTHCRRNGGARNVLQDDRHCRNTHQDEKWPTSGFQIANVGVHPDRREEIDEQDVSRRQLEIHLQPGDRMKQPKCEGERYAAGYWLGDVVLAQEAKALVQRFPDEQHDDPECDREKRPHV